MNGLVMDYPLTLSTIFRRAETLCRRREIVWRAADTSLQRYTFADFAVRSRRLARVLLDLGITPGDRVATLGWNHGPHLDAYFGIPLVRRVLHTPQPPPRRRRAQLHRQPRRGPCAIVDESLLPFQEDHIPSAVPKSLAL